MMLSLNDIAHKILDENVACRQDKFLDILCKEELQKHGCLYVTDDDGILEGIVTDGDIRRTFRNQADVGPLLVADVISPSFLKVDVGSPPVEAYRLMVEQEINHLPIVDEQGKLVASLTFHDLVEKLSPEQIFLDLSEKTDLSENEQRHVARYKFATNFIQPNSRVLDGACGVGYGSNILSKNGCDVVSIDANQDAITYAKKHYAKASADFRVVNIAALDFPAESFDAVVSLETLEHIPYDVCRDYLLDISKWVKPGGILIASSPMLRYKDGKPYVTNPYHINELARADLLDMFKTCLPGFVLHLYHQEEKHFVPLLEEHTGFCILVARKV